MRWYGISDEFYTTIFKNFHGFQFSTLELEDIPSVALPILDDIVPLTRSRTHESWSVGNSQEVFTKATESCDVRLSCRVLAVRLENRQHIVITEKERTPDQIAIQSKDDVLEERFDRVVFAVSNPHAVSNILRCGGQIGPYESILLDAVDTHDMMSRVDWKDWLISPYHQDVSCVAEKYREILLSDAAFLVDHDVNGGEMLEDGMLFERVSSNKLDKQHVHTQVPEERMWSIIISWDRGVRVFELPEHRVSPCSCHNVFMSIVILISIWSMVCSVHLVLIPIFPFATWPSLK